MLKTSYFANKRIITDFRGRYASIASSSPQWYTGKKFPYLAPPRELVQAFKGKSISQALYVKEYNSILETLDINFIQYELIQNDIIILLCWESPEKFCHRHLVSKWFKKHGIDCAEAL